MASKPPFLGRPFRAPIVAAEQPRVEAAEVSFADMVRMLGEGIADAQVALDRASAEMVRELAASRVEIIPEIVETIAADGSVSYKAGKPQAVSLLDIGILPTFYQFAEASVELVMDVRISETIDEKTKEKRTALFTSTREVTTDRQFNRDVKATSKFTARLVPVPSPLRINPVRRSQEGS
jgi:hypothetical protein